MMRQVGLSNTALSLGRNATAGIVRETSKIMAKQRAWQAMIEVLDLLA